MTYSELNIFNFHSFPVGVRFLLDGLISVSVARCELTKLSRAAGAILWCESPQRAVREMTAELQSACAHVSCLPLTRPPPEAVIESVRDCLLSKSVQCMVIQTSARCHLTSALSGLHL